MPLRLYRDDSYLTTFDARVTASTPPVDGVISIELDRTAFYPTGGGQPHDTGRIAGLPVIDVCEDGRSGIVHLLRAGTVPSGDVKCEIDWARRFDHMQQHTGQHILSKAFIDVAGAATRSFHMGEMACSIDLEVAVTDETKVRRAEALANEIVFGDSPVTVEQIPAEEASRLQEETTLFRDLALKPGDPVRLIKIGAFDETPCGGTHVRRSGEVGVVAVRSWEKFKGGTRVTFACGGRVVKMLGDLGRVVDQCVGKLSARPEELPDAVERLQELVGEGRRELKDLGGRLAGLEAAALDSSARAIGSCRVVLRTFQDRTADYVMTLARRIADSAGRIALLAAIDGRGGTTTLVFTRSAEGTPSGLKMGETLARVCSGRGGRGGGGATFARGGGIPPAAAGEALEEALVIVASHIESR